MLPEAHFLQTPSPPGSAPREDFQGTLWEKRWTGCTTRRLLKVDETGRLFMSAYIFRMTQRNANAGKTDAAVSVLWSIDQNWELPKGLCLHHIWWKCGADKGVYGQVSTRGRDYWNTLVFMTWLEREKPSALQQEHHQLSDVYSRLGQNPEAQWNIVGAVRKVNIKLKNSLH